LPQFEGRVLSTLNEDGSRRWLCPNPSPGVFHWWRGVVGWLLIIVFAALPWIRIDGRPAVLLDVVRREFTLFGTTFRPTDTLLLALLFLTFFLLIFLATAVLGRVWCGWVCPQTVYMEFLYRPLERVFLGKCWGGRRKSAAIWRRVLMWLTFLVISAHLANTFLAYFVGTDELVEWTRHSPFNHPTPFIIFVVTTALMMFDFCFFREQLCTLVCPYGRFQSALLDRASLIVGYDAARGEPRGKKRRGGNDEALGDCIDCRMCVSTCPTGIDIRDGLQLECIHCAQCIDACDAIMDKIDRPRGLIRYSTQDVLENTVRRKLRWRLLIYPMLLGVVATSLVTMLVIRQSADVVALRTQIAPFSVLEDGRVQNILRLRIDNRGEELRIYTLSAVDGDDLHIPVNPVEVPAIDSQTVVVLAHSDPEDYRRGRRRIRIRVADGVDFDREFEFDLLGPLGTIPIRGGAR